MTSMAATRREPVPSSVLGVLLFASAEMMFFAGLISAFTISRAGARPGQWTLPTEPLLPASTTLLNTGALIASGLVLLLANAQYRRRSANTARTILVSFLLGTTFVVLQGREWVGLLSGGLTLFSSPLGAFFYLIVGAHALHAIGALIALAMAWQRMRAGTLTTGFFFGVQTFWYFVVGIWPIIYARVYF